MWHKLALLLLWGCVEIMEAREKSKIGTFRSSLVRVVECERTTYPRYEEPPMSLYLELYNTSTKHFLLRGNLTVTKEVKNIKIQVKTYVWENNKWALFYYINNMGCHGTMLAMVLTMFHIRYDSKSCTFLKGPYRSSVDRTGPCKTLSHRAVKNPSVFLDMEVYNTSSKYFLLRGNLNVTRDTKNVVIRVKSFLWMNGKWKINYLISNLPCHGMMLPMAMTFFGIRFKPQECMFPKASNHFENINMDEMRHMVASAAEYGRMLYRTEMFSGNMQTIFCWEFEGRVVPVN